MTKLVFSSYQKNIFENVKSGKGNTAVLALAGSSKTTTLVESLNHLPKKTKAIVIAFNKSIQEELQKRVSENVDCMTLHSLGFRGIRLKFGNVTLDNYKVHNIIDSLSREKISRELTHELTKTVSFCKATLTDCPSKIMDLMDDYDIDPSPMQSIDFANLVVKILAKCKEITNVIDFDDMIWFPFVYNINIGKWDAIFVDEAQDLNYAQVAMALSAAHENSRIFIFLDRHQAIYRFRAADFSTVNTVIEKLNPTKLPLPICYRCPKKVVGLAKEIVPEIESYDNNQEGNISFIFEDEMTKNIKPGNIVLSRTNAPMIKHCLKFLKSGIPSNIKGQDIGSNLLSFVKKSKSKTISGLIEYIHKWKDREYKRLLKEKKQTEVVIDKADCLLNLCDDCKTIDQLKKLIQDLFVEVSDDKKVLFSSVHKFKGLENDNIFLLRSTFRPKESEEESNIYYVALTRSKNSLTFVTKRK